MYVSRDINNKINGVFAQSQSFATETLDDNNVELLAFKNPPPTITELLRETESIGVIARKLEEIIDFIENGTPLSLQTKDWVSNRKGIRG